MMNNTPPPPSEADEDLSPEGRVRSRYEQTCGQIIWVITEELAARTPKVDAEIDRLLMSSEPDAAEVAAPAMSEQSDEEPMLSASETPQGHEAERRTVELEDEPQIGAMFTADMPRPPRPEPEPTPIPDPNPLPTPPMPGPNPAQPQLPPQLATHHGATHGVSFTTAETPQPEPQHPDPLPPTIPPWRPDPTTDPWPFPELEPEPDSDPWYNPDLNTNPTTGPVVRERVVTRVVRVPVEARRGGLVEWLNDRPGLRNQLLAVAVFLVLVVMTWLG